MSKIMVRRATASDIDHYLQLQATRWREENIASRENLESRYKVFPEGMLVAEEEGEIVGMVYAMRISAYDDAHPKSWYEITNNGRCDNHDPDGPILFGVDLTTAPGVGARAGDALLVGIAQMVIQHNIEWCMLGGRMPDYHKYQHKMSAEKYLRAKDKRGRALDKQVRFYTSIPGLKAVRVIPDYFDDPESVDYGVLLRWHNPFYNRPFRNVWAGLFPKLFALEEAYTTLSKKIKRSHR